MICITPFSMAFWLCYLCGGLSDFADGFIARKMNLQSSFGAKLDSIADAIFAVVIAVVVILNIKLPGWLWVCCVFIVLIRVIGYLIGFYKYHTFSSLHTYANKVTGALIFISPMLYVLIGLNITIMILSAMAVISSTEELIITVKNKELNRDLKSIFFC